jgi:hypothetical protein
VYRFLRKADKNQFVAVHTLTRAYGGEPTSSGGGGDKQLFLR